MRGSPRPSPRKRGEGALAAGRQVIHVTTTRSTTPSSPASALLEHIKLERPLLAAHCELAERPAGHAWRERGEAVDEGG
jgi:hypothetical protein